MSMHSNFKRFYKAALESMLNGKDHSGLPSRHYGIIKRSRLFSCKPKKSNVLKLAKINSDRIHSHLY